MAVLPPVHPPRRAPRSWRPAPLRRWQIPKANGGWRQLGVPRPADQARARALLARLQPGVEALLGPEVWGCRPGRSCAGALAALAAGAGVRAAPLLVKADLRALFPSLPLAHVRAGLDLLAARGALVPADRAEVEAALRAWADAPGVGLPQGSALSPLLANLALHVALDAPLRTAAGGPVAWVRYVDDLLLVFDGPPAPALALLDGLARAAGLALAPEKLHLRAPGDGRGPLPALGGALALRPCAGGWRLVVAAPAPGRAPVSPRVVGERRAIGGWTLPLGAEVGAPRPVAGAGGLGAPPPGRRAARPGAPPSATAGAAPGADGGAPPPAAGGAGPAAGAQRPRVSVGDHALIHGAATAAGLVGAGLARLPGADLPVLTGLQASLVTALALRRGVPLGRAAAVDLVLQLLAGMTGRWIAGQLGALLPPGAGEAVRAGTAAALTEAVGWAAVAFFEAERAAEAQGAGRAAP